MTCCKNQKMNNSALKGLGGWSFEPELYNFLINNLKEGSTILELGSGYGTEVLSKHYKMYSIEHNFKFIGKYNSTYIHAPMKGHWYDIDIVQHNLPTNYDCILVDGPVGSESKNRIGFYEQIHLFDTSVMMIFDDTNRDGEATLFKSVLDYCNRVYPANEGRLMFKSKTFSVIYPIL